MTIVRANCDTCGPVDLRPRDLILSRCLNAPALSSLTYPCPLCKAPQVMPAPAEVTKALDGVSIRTTFWSVPAEALEPHHGDVITMDDVIDFRLGLDAELADLLGRAA
jgi:hypothetical protein